tara:strand:+ start:503 stop:1315 length:813 start_codon:yes stop_codon:yes gene_type:complete
MNKFLTYLTPIFKIPYKVQEKIKFVIDLKKYNRSEYEEKQNKIFNKINLNRSSGIEKLQSIKKKFDLKIQRSMSSEHETLFSSIAINNNYKIHKILEIGTFDGYNALLLSKIFPEAEIETIDLPNDNSKFRDSYQRSDRVDTFIKKRDETLAKSNNITFNQINSIELVNHNNKYDLIWIDGAHGYPIVCIDIINSLKLINDKGIILCDDVYLDLKISKSDEMYNSLASYETLKVLADQKLIKLELIFKRLGSKDNCSDNQRKFIAVVFKN